MVRENQELAYEKTAELLRRSQRPLFITGAGISADSGLPTYRGIGGLYETGDTEEGIAIEVALSGTMLLIRPELAWKYLWQMGAACARATFNRGHEVIAQIEALKPDTWVLTQNIDGFHRDAGTQNLIEIHGRADELYCLECSDAFAAAEVIAGYRETPVLPPQCPRCDGVIRPNVVLFGEALPPKALELLVEKAGVRRDLVVAIGTTGVFPYIAGPVVQAHSQGIPTIEINPSITGLSGSVDYHLREGAAKALGELWNRMQ